MLAWMKDLTPRERRTMGACFGGWALDAFDVQMYSFVIPTVIALWGLSRGEAGLIGTVTLLISSLGGWFSGTLADRFGRVRMLQITILWYSFFTFLCAFAQNFEQLFVLRALHGLGFGGEWAAGAVLMGEVIRDKYRGRGVGIVQTGWAVGWGASALVYTALYAFLPEAIAWRVLFAIGLLPAVSCSGSAGTSTSPKSFATARRERPAVGVGPSVRGVPRPASVDDGQGLADGRRRAGRRLCAGHLDADLSAHGARLVGDQHRRVSAGPDPRRADRLSDRLLSERRDRPQMDLSVVGDRLVGHGAGLHVRADEQRRAALPRDPAQYRILMKFPPMGPFMTELYPTAVRGTAQGFCYNAGRAIGSFFPTMVGFLSDSLSLGAAIAVFSAFAFGLMIMMLLMLPETRGRSLQSLEPTPAALTPSSAAAGSGSG